MVEVPSLRVPQLLYCSLARCGYLLDASDDVPDRLFFQKRHDSRPTHHLSVCEAASQFWHSHLEFRDRLRADRALAGQYLALKKSLSQIHRTDRPAYTRSKAEFIRTVLQT
jgi:GrpB-like predicted nucleotidyltransferase (UPF0157 family)